MIFEHHRRDYGVENLDISALNTNPLQQLRDWLQQAIAHDCLDATAMHLATVDNNNQPDSRVVLLKEITEQGVVFYTDYQSHKGKQLNNNPKAAVSLYWPQISKQVRLRGDCVKTSRRRSTAYFASRPVASQQSAFVSRQSEVIASIDVLKTQLQQMSLDSEPDCPERWGGYELIANEFEFFLGRDSRLHDRFRYRLHQGKWSIERLSP